jgi:hypothetical protein
MTSEVDVYGVLLPPLLVCLALALPLSAILRRALAWAGVYRFVWHRPLFDFCLLVLLTGLVSLVLNIFV